MAKLFGIADIISGFLFVAGFYHIDIPHGMMIAFGVYLILKGILFLMNLFSLIDIAAGILLVSGLIFSVYPLLLIGLAGFLAIKGIISLFTVG